MAHSTTHKLRRASVAFHPATISTPERALEMSGFPSARSAVRSLALLLLAGLLVATLGCRRASPASEAVELAADLEARRREVADATAADPEADVAKTAERAARNYARLVELSGKNSDEAAVATALTKAEPIYVELRRAARLAHERRACAELLRGFKVRGYRAARRVAVPRLLALLAAAARQMAATDPATLPEAVRQTAQLAARLAGSGGEVKFAALDPAAQAEWLRIAAELEGWSRDEPAELPLALAVGFLCAGKSELSLVEFDRVVPARLERPAQAPVLPLLRALAYSRLGFIELAATEAGRLSADDEQGRQLLALIHALLAYTRVAEKDWPAADAELAHAVRIWPNNPLVVYLSGERLLADGRREKALENFSRATAGTDSAWLAPLLEKRIREVRDSTGAAPPLLRDDEFLVKCALHLTVEYAKRTEGGRRLAELLGAAQQLPTAMDTPAESARE